MPGVQFDALTAALTAPAAQLRETQLTRRRRDRPRQQATTAPRPALTLPAKILALILYDRHHLPQPVIAALYHTRDDTISKHICDTRRLLAQAGHTITPAPRKLTTLNDLCDYATTAGITLPAHIKTAC